MYRASSTSREATVAYGPFPLAWWKLAAAPGVWFVAFFLAGAAPARLQIDCAGGGCEVVSQAWRRPVVRRAGDRGLLARAEVGDRTRGKKGEWSARTRVFLGTGESLVLEREPLAVAEWQAAQVAAFASGQAGEFHHDSGDQRWLAPVAWLLYLAGAGLVVDALRKRRALELRVSRGAVTVAEMGRWRRQPARSVAIGEGSEVRVDWHLLRAAGARTSERWGATLTVVERGRPDAALTTVPREGVMVHYDAAAALREAAGGSAAGPVSACPEGAWNAWGGEGRVGTVSSVWLGLGCGSLAGMGVYAVVMVAVDPGALGRNVDGGAMVAAALGAVGLAALLVALRRAKERERERYRRLAAGR